MDFAEKSYVRLCAASDEVGLGERRGEYLRDRRYLEHFLFAQNVHFEVLRMDFHDVELTPYLDVKEVGDAPVRYLPAWLKNKKIRASAIGRIKRIDTARSNESFNFIMSKILPKKSG